MAAIPTIGVRWSEMEALDRAVPDATTRRVRQRTGMNAKNQEEDHVTDIAIPRPRLLPALAIGLAVLLGTTGLVPRPGRRR